MTIKTFPSLGPFQTNSYLLIDEATRHAAVIDPSFDSECILAHIKELGLTIDWILNTHGHCDHIVNNRFFVEQTGAPLALHRADLDFIDGLEDQLALFGLDLTTSPQPDHLLEAGEQLRVGSLELKVIETPGHSPGSVTFLVEDVALSGDALFAGSIGRVDLPGGDFDTLIHSIRTRLFTLPDATRVLSGHGPETTIGQEKRTNPFFTE